VVYRAFRSFESSSNQADDERIIICKNNGMLRPSQIETNALIEISQAAYVIGSGIRTAKIILADNSRSPNFDFLARPSEGQ